MIPFLCIYFCVRMTMSGYVPVGVGACGGQREVNPLGLDLWAVVRYVMWVLGLTSGVLQEQSMLNNCWVIYLSQYLSYLDACMCMGESYSVFFVISKIL